jgi:hypothetical protein
MQRLYNGTALQLHRGMQWLSSNWDSCFITVDVLCKTMPRLSGGTASPLHRSSMTRLQRSSYCALDALAEFKSRGALFGSQARAN